MGTDLQSRLSAALKMAVFAPIPSASVTIAMAAVAGLLVRLRTA
jgi:hypothetical protein